MFDFESNFSCTEILPIVCTGEVGFLEKINPDGSLLAYL